LGLIWETPATVITYAWYLWKTENILSRLSMDERPPMKGHLASLKWRVSFFY